MGRRDFLRAAAFSTAIAVLTASGSISAAAPKSAGISPLSPGVLARPFVKHVVVIVQENRTFDNLFGGPASPALPKALPYPGAHSTFPAAVTKLMQYTTLDAPGPYGSHDAWACLNQGSPYPRFSTQQWIAVAKKLVTSPPVCAHHDYWFFHAVPQFQRTIYWEIARKYGLGDRFFAPTSSASFPPHQFIVSGAAQFKQDNTVEWVADQPEPEGGCFDAQQETTSVPVVGTANFSQTLTYLGNSRGHCYDRETYGDRFDEAGRSWIHYTTDMPSHTRIFDGFINIRKWYQQTLALGTQPSQVATHFRKTTQVLDDAGSLPQFAWVKPPCGKQSDHPGNGQGSGGHNGPNWVGSVINAIGKSSDWSSTVIFVIWDDWGGFYDHAVPPGNAPGELGPGVRIPILVVSPYLARPGRVVSTYGNGGSIMRFADELFNIEPLTSYDSNAPDLNGWFDFSTAKASTPFVPITGAQGTGRWKDDMCTGSPAWMLD